MFSGELWEGPGWGAEIEGGAGESEPGAEHREEQHHSRVRVSAPGINTFNSTEHPTEIDFFPLIF